MEIQERGEAKGIQTLCGRHDVHAATLAIEHYLAVNQREQRIIFALSDIPTGVKFVAYLTHQNVAGPHALAAKSLDSSTLRSWSRDRFDWNLGPSYVP